MAVIEDVRLRMLDDLLNAERCFRELAERRVRALTAVLIELAYRLAGERLEQMRQTDPGAPGTWEPEDWQRFFLAVSLTAPNGWRPNGNGHAADQEIAALQARIAALERELAFWREQAQEKEPQRAAPRVEVEEETPAVARSTRLANFRMPKIPQAYAHRWQVRAEMSKADAELHLRRRGMVLKCLADGLSTQVEIGRYVGDATGAQYRAGSIRRVFDALEESGLILRQTLTLQVTSDLPTRLAVARLTAEGKAFCQALGWKIVESDWERLLRLHKGDAQEGHTLACLLVASAARLLGYQVALLPEVEESKARPDMRLSRDGEEVYVEVETGTRLHEGNAKWRMNAALNGGRVALIARNGQERQRLIEDCRHVAEHGMATDIESLIAVRFAEWSEGGTLWAETW